MKDLTDKFDNTAGPTGQYTAAEFNDFHEDVQTAVMESGQTLTPGVGEDARQTIKAIAIGGARIIRTDTQTAQIGEIVLAQNMSADVTINLPSSGLFINATVYFEQIFNQPFSINKLIVGRSGNTIGGLAEDMDVTTDNIKFKVVWDGSTWIPYKTELVGNTL